MKVLWLPYEVWSWCVFTLLKLWLYPWKFILDYILTWKPLSLLKKYISSLLTSTPSQFSIRWSIRLAMLLLSVILGTLSATGQYALLYYVSIPVDI